MVPLFKVYKLWVKGILVFSRLKELIRTQTEIYGYYIV